jgi:23S rRNA (guanosine2251-2'-O)-methyltransferase
MKLNAQQLRTGEYDSEIAQSIPKNDIVIILDNVLDTYNVGAIFRLADAIAVKKVILCGETLTPPNSRIKKASINTWQWVSWEYEKTAAEAIRKIKMKEPTRTMIGIEQDKRSKPFQSFTYTLPLAIIVGHESNGVTPEALDLCDYIVELPMWGINVSLNVMVSCGIILYEIMRQQITSKV